MIIPKIIQIENVSRHCNARCIMCSWKTWTRPADIMDLATFQKILFKLPIPGYFSHLSIYGCGEPLIDKGIHHKIALAKSMGFKGTGIASNCGLLDPIISERLIDAKLDTLICSIDGILPKTHEAIRVGTSLVDVMSNVQDFIRLRNKKSTDTRFYLRKAPRVVIRFIRQPLNYDEWPAFKKFWEGVIDKSKGDEVVKFDVHNWGGKLFGVREKVTYCADLYDRLWIFSDGRLGLCCADDNGFYDLGNVLADDPIKLYNGTRFTHYRNMITEGRADQLPYCKDCNIPFCREHKNDHES